MKSSKRVKRRAAARVLHIGCSALDSARLTALGEFVGVGSVKGLNFWQEALTEKEARLLKQRFEAIRDRTAEIREIARHVEKPDG